MKSQCEKWPKKDLTGNIFNNWKVLGLSHREDGGMWYWDIKCTNCGFEAKRFTNYVKTSKRCICCGLLPKGETGLNKVICAYRDSAKQKSLSFELTKEQVRHLTSSRCYYCGCLPSTLKCRKYKNDRSSWGDYVYNGIDRVDNGIGYIMSNCVSCCETCNRGKGAMNVENWHSYIEEFVDNALNKKIPFLNNT